MGWAVVMVYVFDCAARVQQRQRSDTTARVVDSGRPGVHSRVSMAGIARCGIPNWVKWLKSQRRPVLYTILTGLT
jgi:hypothetical protein